MVRPEGEQLQALRPGLEGARRRGRDANGVPRADVEEALVELHPPVAAENDVDLLGFGMAMGERTAHPRPQAEVGDSGALGMEHLARDARFPAVAEAVPRGR